MVRGRVRGRAPLGAVSAPVRPEADLVTEGFVRSCSEKVRKNSCDIVGFIKMSNPFGDSGDWDLISCFKVFVRLRSSHRRAPGGLLAAPGCPWLPLAAPGCSWLPLAAPGCSWLLLAAPGCSWLLLAAPGCSWLLLGAPGCSWLLLAAAGCCWLLLAAPGRPPNPG